MISITRRIEQLKRLRKAIEDAHNYHYNVTGIQQLTQYCEDRLVAIDNELASLRTS